MIHNLTEKRLLSEVVEFMTSRNTGIIFSVIVSILILIIHGIIYPATVSASNNIIINQEGFNNSITWQPSGSTNGWYRTNGTSDTIIQVINEQGNPANSLKVNVPPVNSAYLASNSFSPVGDGSIVGEFDFYMPWDNIAADKGNFRMELRDAAGRSGVRIAGSAHYKLFKVYYVNASTVKKVAANPNRWHHVMFSYNVASNQTDVYLDNVLMGRIFKHCLLLLWEL